MQLVKRVKRILVVLVEYLKEDDTCEGMVDKQLTLASLKLFRRTCQEYLALFKK